VNSQELRDSQTEDPVNSVVRHQRLGRQNSSSKATTAVLSAFGYPSMLLIRLYLIDFEWFKKILAERVGFEPTLELPLNTLSKRAPSATRPSLRFEGGDSLAQTYLL
jgi:hypothetical protein